jgi:hypothetical protein
MGIKEPVPKSNTVLLSYIGIFTKENTKLRLLKKETITSPTSSGKSTRFYGWILPEKS